MGKIAFLVAGQGAQAVGMGQDICEQYEVYKDLACRDEFKSYQTLMTNGPIEELSKTENTQPCMSLFAAGVMEVLKANGIKPDVACGLSLGEYGALYVAGVFSAEEYVKLTAFRGEQMMKAAAGIDCSMSAILGMEADKVKEACSQVTEGFVTVANYNCPGQYVICGEEKGVAAAEAILKEAGAKRMVRLNVSGPFHTKYMAPAGEALRERFDEMNFGEPTIPVIMNYTGKALNDSLDGKDSVSAIKDLLVKQVQNSVQFEETMYTLFDMGVDTFVEIGPGKTLAGFLKKGMKAKGVEGNVYSITTAEDLAKVIDELR